MLKNYKFWFLFIFNIVIVYFIMHLLLKSGIFSFTFSFVFIILTLIFFFHWVACIGWCHFRFIISKVLNKNVFFVLFVSFLLINYTNYTYISLCPFMDRLVFVPLFFYLTISFNDKTVCHKNSTLDLKNAYLFFVLPFLYSFIRKIWDKYRFHSYMLVNLSFLTCFRGAYTNTNVFENSNNYAWSPVFFWGDKIIYFIENFHYLISQVKIPTPLFITVVFAFFVVLIAILATALLTLTERIILAKSQLRSGPDKVSYGFLQPISDAFKLILKEFVIPDKSIVFVYRNIALFGFVCASALLIFLPFSYFLIFSDNDYNFLFIFFSGLLHVYATLLSGWSSKSKYSFLGSVRTSSQLISYDITLMLVTMHVFAYTKSLSIVSIIEYESFKLPFCIVAPYQVLFFIIAGAAETSRHPFDLPEAEPELVSGYNVEYSAIRFALFFLSEYLSVILFSNLVVSTFFGGWAYYMYFQNLEYVVKITSIVFIIIKLRAILPRYRVDQLMRVCWKFIIPFELLSLILTLIFAFINI